MRRLLLVLMTVMLGVGASTAHAISIRDASKSEGDTGISQLTFTIDADVLLPNENCDVPYTTSNGTATFGTDFVTSSGSVELTAEATGLDTEPANVDIVGDTAFEPDETFTVTLGTPVCFDYEGQPAAATINDGTGLGTILNDDPSPDPCEQTGAIKGTPGNDKLTGTNGPDVICGLGGNDTIRGLSGDDTLIGGQGDDTIDGGTGENTLEGDDGTDRLTGGTSDDTIDGGTGSDKLAGGGGNDTITDGTGNDILQGGAGSDQLTSGPGDDTLQGGAGDDTLKGEANADKLFGEAGADTLDGGDGNDALNGGAGADACVQGAGTGARVACEA